MKNKIYFFTKVLVFFCIFIILMLALGKLFFSRSYLYSWTSYEAVFKLPKNSVDIILAGTSTIQNSVLNLEVYRDTNLKVLSIASSGEPLELTYHKLKEMYKYQSPKVVVLDIYYNYIDLNKPDVREDASIKTIQEQYMHYCMDITDFSFGKICAINKCVWDEYKLSYTFPILTYHTTWKKMDENVKFDNKRFYNMNIILKNSKSYESKSIIYQDGEQKKKIANEISRKTKDEIINDEIYEVSINESLYKIVDLVKKNGSIIVLMTAPKVDCEYELMSARLLELELGEDEQVKFFNSIYQVEDFDYTTDLQDYWHVNYNGAKKVTEALKRYIVNDLKVDISNLKRDSIWDDAYNEYLEFMFEENNIVVTE